MFKTKLAFLVVCVSVAFLTGCSSKPKADLYGSNGNMIGSGPIIEGGMPMLSEQFAYPDNVNREMFTPVLFAYDSSQVSPQEAPKVENVAKYLLKNKDGVIVEGHTDERGSREYNLALGERRALAVREYLITMGVGAERIQTNSKGEEDPAAFGRDETSWQQNRRAVFGIYK